LQPVGDFVAATQQLLQFAHLTGQGLPRRQGGLGAGAEAGQEQRILPVGFSPQALAAGPGPHPRRIGTIHLPTRLLPRPQRKRQFVASCRFQHDHHRLLLRALRLRGLRMGRCRELGDGVPQSGPPCGRLLEAPQTSGLPRLPRLPRVPRRGLQCGFRDIYANE
jgi:hypothetical protein